MTEPRGPKTWTPPPDREILQRERKHEEPPTDAKFDAHIERMGKEGHTA